MSKRFQPLKKPTGTKPRLNNMPIVSKPSPALNKPSVMSNMSGVSKPPVNNMPAVSKPSPAVNKPSVMSNMSGVSKPPVSNMPVVSKPSPAVSNKSPASNMSGVSKPPARNMATVDEPHVSNMLLHKLDEILKEADKQIDRSSTQNIYEQVYSEIYLNQKKQKFWVDKNLKNCFMLYAKSLKVIWGAGDTPWYWKWVTMEDQESRDASTFEAAELVNVCWLEINGKFETFKLSPGTTYEVVFILMIKNPSYGWEIPVNLRLTLPDKTIQHHMENLNEKPRETWIELPVGVFMTSNQNMSNGSTYPTEDMEVSLYETEGGIWKKGLVIKGVCIRPKINP